MENNSSENNSSLTEEEKRLVERYSELHRPIFKLEFNWGKTKPKNSSQPSSDNNPSQEKKS
jgi:hypothetical protein